MQDMSDGIAVVHAQMGSGVRVGVRRASLARQGRRGQAQEDGQGGTGLRQLGNQGRGDRMKSGRKPFLHNKS